MRYGATLLLACLLAAIPVVVEAEQFARVGSYGGQFVRIPVDARGEAMGLATTVNPTGALAFWWNPAPLPESDRVVAAYTIRDWPADIHWQPLAVRASRGNLTFGAMWGRLRTDPMVVRTAYEPDGNGETFEASSELLLFSIAADLVPWLAQRPTRWSWSVGTSARHVREGLAETRESAWDADLGTTLARTAVAEPTFALRFVGTAMVRNLFASDLVFDEIASPMPRYYHFGLGFDARFGGYWRGEPQVLVTVAHTWRRYIEEEFWGVDSEHLGLEVVLGGVAAVRLGHRDPDVLLAEGWSWGAGLQWRFERLHGLRTGVDYARTELPEHFGPGSYDHWTLSLGVDLP